VLCTIYKLFLYTTHRLNIGLCAIQSGSQTTALGKRIDEEEVPPNVESSNTVNCEEHNGRTVNQRARLI